MINSITILKTYFRFAWRYKGYFIGTLISTPIANISLRIIPPLIVASVLNRLTNHDFIDGKAWESFSNDLIWYGLISIFGGVIMWRLVIYLIWKLESFVQRDLYRAMFDKFSELDTNFHANNFGGSLVSQTSKLVGAYVRVQDVMVFQIYLMLVAYTTISIIMWPKSHVFVFGIWLFSLLFISVSMIISIKVRKLATAEANAQNKTTGQLADAITNVLTIKSFAGRQYENHRFAKTTENSRQKTVDLMWGTTWRDLFSSSVTSGISIMALVIAVFAVVKYKADIGLVFLMFTYTADITERLWEFSSQALRNYNRAIGDAQEGVKTLLTKPLVEDKKDPKLLPNNASDIEFSDMTFAHEKVDGHNLFEDFNLKIEPNTRVGLVGHSGSGKTTLVRLLMRYMDIDNGQIKIGGQNIAKVSQDNLRKNIAYVPQEPLLFHRSLAENISYGKQDATQADIEKAAEMANAHEFIQELSKGYETLVGERGVKLSGGQRQRVAIARAMLKNAPILVLDEATSALDSESEVLIQDALWKLMQNKTAIVIAHRLSTVQKLDRIIVLDKGRIVEDGSHNELLKKNGTYAKLWAHQSGGFLED